jgi:hypothetical protein
MPAYTEAAFKAWRIASRQGVRSGIKTKNGKRGHDTPLAVIVLAPAPARNVVASDAP